MSSEHPDPPTLERGSRMVGTKKHPKVLDVPTVMHHADNSISCLRVIVGTDYTFWMWPNIRHAPNMHIQSRAIWYGLRLSTITQEQRHNHAQDQSG